MSVRNPIIVIGTGRSGTTVVSEVLFRHRELAFPSNYNEKFPRNPDIGHIRKFFDNKAYRIFGKKEQSISETPLFNKILFTPSEAWSMWEYATGLGERFSRSYLLNEKVGEENLPSVRNYFERLVVAQGRNRLAVKLTGPSRMEYLSSIFEDPIFIYVERKPVPTISSFLKVPFWKKQGLTQLWWTGPFSEEEIELVAKNKDNGIWMTAFQIKKIMDVTNSEIQKFNPRLLRIRYENFAYSPIDVTTDILNFCKLSLDKSCFDYINKNKIVSKNFQDSNYFDKKNLDLIYSVFGDSGYDI